MSEMFVRVRPSYGMFGLFVVQLRRKKRFGSHLLVDMLVEAKDVEWAREEVLVRHQKNIEDVKISHSIQTGDFPVE